MLERGDMTALHEPFIYLYYVHDRRKTLDYFDPDHPPSYHDIREMVLAAAEQGPVFVKDKNSQDKRYFSTGRSV